MGKAGADEAGAGVSGPDEAADGASGRVDAPNIPAVNFKITDEARLGQGTEGEKFRDNIEAIRILKQLEADGGRRATAEEQNRLARYVGWGGMANAFASPTTGEFKPDWKKRGEELRDLLTDEEYRQARRSTPNAHYTSETVVKAMWRAAERLGFKGGLALETSMGTGNFIGLMPESAAAKFIGIEYDSVTARIAAALYPASAVYHTGFHKVPLPYNTFALAIGNPPFGKNSLRFQYRPELAGVSIHNQFFRAAMDAVRPGGLQIMVVSRYLMDAKDGTSRRALAHDADLVAAIRLPDTAFKENARTEVVTDIIILKKLDGEAAKERADAFAATTEKPERERDKEQARQARAARIPDWVNTTEIDDPLGGAKITVNSYFAANPGQIIGTLERSGSMAAGEDVTVRLGAAVERGKMTQAERDAHDAAVAAEMAARLNAAVDRLPENIHSLDAEVMAATEARFKSLADGLRIALGGLEPGHIAIDADGKLTRIIEQETPEGQLQFSKQALTAESPWSEQLSQDDKGRWYRMVETFDEKGVKRKVLDEQGRPTRSNLYERQTFENEADVPPTLRLGAAKFEKLKALVRLRDTLKRQLVLESTDAAESLQEENRARLRKGYEAFVAKHGPVNRLTNIAIHASMPDSGLISALEVKYEPERSKEAAEKAGLDPQPETVVPAPILTSRVVPKYVPVTSAANATDALSITLSEFGRVNLDRMAQLTGKSPDEVTTELQKGEKPLIYFDPEEGEWQTADAYLSGLVRRKLEAAREAGLEKNIAALEPIQPKPWTADKVTALLGSTWVPTKHYEAFVQHLLGGRATVRFYPLTNLFTVETHGASDPEQWRTEDASAEWLVTRILNSQKIVVFDVDRDGNRHVNHDGTALANIKAEEIRNEFADWVYKDSDRRNELVDIFNDKFNVRVNRQHDGSHLTLVGKNPNIQMRRHQNNAIWRGISERFMLVDHVVGAGKTFTAIGRAMERRRMGLSKKPMIVVPNHLVEQWESDVYRLYPGAKVLAAGKKDFDPKRRRRLFAKIATGDWDIVIVPHSSFGFIGISPETEQRYLDAEYQIALEAVKEAEDQAAADGFSGRGKPLGVKQAEALVAAIEARLDKLREGARDRLLTFEQMGVDDLTIDEAHEFKNLFYTSKMSEARGMGPRAGSRKAADLYNKVRVIRETKTGTVTFMTGTPISNSAVEMYTMMRYLAADQLKDQGLEHFDAWRVQYVDASTAFEPNDSGGGLKEVSRLGRNWANMRSLMDLYYQFTDAVTNDDIKRWYKEDTGLDFPIPAIKGGERQLVKVKPTPAQVDWLLQLISDFDDLPNIADPNARNAERLRLMDRARKISLDIRAVEPTHPSKEEGGKLDQVADNVKRIYAASTPDKGTQLIFVDRGVPRSRGDDKIIASYDRVIARRDAALQKGDEAAYEEALEDLEKFNANEIEELRIAQRGGWNAYAQIKKNLIARGVPEKEIRFVQEADNDEQKAALFEAVRQGKVRVLLGSTPKMGAGTNVQDRLVALHHVDVTWKPSDIEQREGRIIRQGNLFATPTLPDGSANPMFKPGFEAEILAYATERTVDAKMWTLNATKLRMINGIRKYDGEFTMEFEDEESVSMAEMAAEATGDVRLIERVQLESAINKLALQENAHRRKLWGMQGEFERAQKTLEQAAPTTASETAFRDMLAAGLKEREAHYAGRSIEVEGKRFAFTDRTKAAEAVEGAIGEAQAAILAQRGPEGKGRYSVNIGGRQFTNEESIINAIEEALGDVTPFLAEIGGRKYGSRTLAARAIAHTVSQRKGNVPAAVGEEVIVPLGSYLGVPLTAGMSRTINQKGAPAIEVYLMLGEDRQRRIAESKESTFHSDLEWSTSAAKSLLDDIDRRAGYRASGAALRDTLGDIDRAKATIEELKDKAHEPFPKAEEISQKRARLKELIAELDTSTPRANAAHHGQAPDDTDDTDDDIAHAQTAPAIAVTDKDTDPEAAAFLQAAWHGSPHVFDSFSTDRIGTGEGAQAYGWGLYFAGKREVAEFYRRKLSKQKAVVTWKGLTTKQVQDQLLDASGADNVPAWDAFLSVIMIEDSGGIDAALADLDRRVAANNRDADKASAEWIRAHRSELDVKLAGRLYKVEVPDDDHLMMWDAPLTEQPKAVKAALAKLGYHEYVPGPLGGRVLRQKSNWADRNGHYIYNDLLNFAGVDAEGVSRKLAAAGIPGHRYLDGGSRAAGTGTYNYVIYDHDRVKVEEFFQKEPRRPTGWEYAEGRDVPRYTPAELATELRSGFLGKQIGALLSTGTLRIAARPSDLPSGRHEDFSGVRGLAGHSGRIWVVASNAESVEEAKGTVLHEAFHAGVRGLLGRKKWRVMMRRLQTMMERAASQIDNTMIGEDMEGNSKRDQFWAARLATVQDSGYPQTAWAEEMAAFAITYRNRAPAGIREVIENLIGQVKAWALKTFGVQLGALTPAELQALAIMAVKAGWETGGHRRLFDVDGVMWSREAPPSEPMPSPEDDRRADLTLRERIAAATTEAMAPALATIPLRPLLSEMGRGIPAFGKYLDAKQGMDAMRNEWHAKIDALAQNWLKFRVFNRHANTALMDLMHMSTIADVDPTRPFESYMTADDHETLRRPRRENDVPDIAWDIARNKQRTDQRRREAYPGLKRQYDALPADAKTLYGETRDMLRELADEQERLIIENARNALENGVREAEREHSRRILEIDEEGLTGRARAQAIAQADEDLHYARNEGRWVRRNRIRELRKKLEKNRIKGPYFPLARFGDYFVTVRDEEDRVESFSKFESRAEQLRFTKELEAEGVDPERVSIGVMSQAEQVRAQVDPQFVADVVEILRESGTDRVLEDAIWQSYLERLPDMSIRKARIHRKGRAGFNEDALRSFANHMFHGAHQNARLKYVPDLAEWLEVAREEARAVNDDEGQIRAELLVNELEHRHAYILNPAGSPLAQTLTQAGFIWHIAMSPASAAVNLSQTFTLGIPALASNHAGAGNGTAESTALAIKELGRAMKDFTFASRPVRTLRQRLGRAIDAAPGMEHSGRLDVDEKAAMHEFYALGLGDRTQGHDLAGIAETGIQYSALRASVMAKVSWAFHKAEVFNREVTFLAAYRMARQRGLDHPLAIDDAAKVTWKAHFDYQNTSRPRIMQGNTARVLLLFKNYSVNMLFRLIWDTKQAFNGKITPDERREAKIQLFGTTMALMATAGIRGTWVMAVVLPLLFGLVFGAGDDDDTSLGEVAIAPLTLLKRLAFGADDHDAEVMRRELMEVLPSWIVGPIMDGMPGYVTGTDLAERVGSGDLWFRAPDRVLEGEDAVAYWLEQILGPVIGIGVNAGKFVFDPPDNLERGFETVLPKALRDIVRGFRYMIDGAETMKGEPIIEDMSPGQWVAQALGFMPAQLAERYRQNSVSKNREKAIMDRRSGLLGDIWDHVGAGEEVPQSVWDDIAKFNAQYPDYPINGKSIKASIAGHQRARANNSGGIVLNQKIERRILEEAAPGTYD